MSNKFTMDELRTLSMSELRALYDRRGTAKTREQMIEVLQMDNTIVEGSRVMSPRVRVTDFDTLHVSAPNYLNRFGYHYECPDCETRWDPKEVNGPHNCLQTFVVEFGKDLYHDFESLTFKLDGYFESLVKAINKVDEDIPKQILLPGVESEVVQTVSAGLLKRLEDAENTAQRAHNLIQQVDPMLSQASGELEAIAEHHETTQKVVEECKTLLVEMNKRVKDLENKVTSLEMQNTLLNKRIEESEAGLFG